MNWDAAGAVGEILGAVAVVITLAYLAKQMRQDSAATTSSSMGSWLADYNGIVLELTRDPEVAQTVRQGLTSFEDLEPNEQLRFHAWMVAHTLNAQSLYLQAEDGTTHLGVTEQVLGFTATLLNTTGGLQWWVTARPIWRPEFVSYMDQLMESSAPVTERWPFFNDAA